MTEDRMEMNRAGCGYSVQDGLDMDLVVRAMDNAEAVAQEQCGSPLLFCQIDELVDGTGLHFDARNVGGSAFVASWPYDSSKFRYRPCPLRISNYHPRFPQTSGIS